MWLASPRAKPIIRIVPAVTTASIGRSDRYEVALDIVVYSKSLADHVSLVLQASENVGLKVAEESAPSRITV